MHTFTDSLKSLSFRVHKKLLTLNVNGFCQLSYGGKALGINNYIMQLN